ncbi:class I SAM-dependent methyltransferase [Rubrivirga sp.]|uniref:class I SAM-dependent methyltransferase n=1 Tax=Rubrivirga sp. TaxID=1885344 RepID=UPI003B5186A4
MSTPNALSSGLSGRDYFAELFRTDLAYEVEWLRRTAGHKADSVVRLLHAEGLTPDSVLEVGAGTGAVIGELRHRGVGVRHYAVDFSEEAIDVLRQVEPGIDAAVADVTETPDPFGAGPYDVALASHVVEHLEEPEAFLRALHPVPIRRLVVEVPLEDLPFGRLKSLLKSRADHPAGHVQFFTRRSFTDLLARSGWRVRHVRVYAPALDAETFELAYGDAGVRMRTWKRATEFVLPRALGPIWTRLYHAHCAALCERA